MHKLLISLFAVLLIKVSCAISLGDLLDEDIAKKNSTTTSQIALIPNDQSHDDKTLTFERTSAGMAITTFLVNKKTSQVYLIHWKNIKIALSHKEILGNYYNEFKIAKKTTAIHRAISMDNGNLRFHQHGNMYIGFAGEAAVKALEPK